MTRATLVLLTLAACGPAKDGGASLGGPWLRTEALTYNTGLMKPGDRAELTVALYNYGDWALTVYEVSVDGASGAWSSNTESGFAVDAASPDGPGEATVELRFAPDEAGLFRDALVIASDDPGPGPTDAETGLTLWTAALRGATSNPCGMVAPAYVDFGERSSGGYVSDEVGLCNCGTVTWTISSYDLEGDHSFGSGTVFPVYVLPSTQETFNIEWIPSSEEPASAEISFLSDAPDMDDTVTLVGNGDDSGGSEATDDDGDGLSEREGDCDDTDASTFPCGEELYDTVDNDCDGGVDEGTYSFDDDEDGTAELEADGAAGDCDDADPWTWPGATEDCDGADNDCDGVLDEGEDEVEDSACAPLRAEL